MDRRGAFIRELAASTRERRWMRQEEVVFECVLHRGEWWAVRQAGPGAYDWQHLEDERGFLTDQPVEGEPASQREFERGWAEFK